MLTQDIEGLLKELSSEDRKPLSYDVDLECKSVNNICYFCVHKDDQQKLNFQKTKNTILSSMNLKLGTPFIQVIGDSCRFSKKGTSLAKKFLNKKLRKGNHIIMWGSIGTPNKNGASDVNELVNTWLRKNPTYLEKSLANLVDKHSIQAINEWGCTFSEGTAYYFLVYGGAKFGDDIYSSDTLADRALVLEGGVQTFAQVINLLSQNKHVEGIYGLRGHENPEYYDKRSNKYFSCFSAIEFLQRIKDETKENKIKYSEINLKIESFKNTYLKENLLFNFTKPGTEEKQALFHEAWRKFVTNKLWRKLDACNFYTARD